jgi:four helix bundle protein
MLIEVQNKDSFDTKKYLELSDISAYNTAYNLSNYLWNLVINWDNFSRRTVGEQYVTAMDSISANIAEGFGRYNKKDKIKFYRYSSGSTRECFDWNEKSNDRKLITEEEYLFIKSELQKIPREINQLIKFTNLKLKI